MMADLDMMINRFFKIPKINSLTPSETGKRLYDYYTCAKENENQFD